MGWGWFDPHIDLINQECWHRAPRTIVAMISGVPGHIGRGARSASGAHRASVARRTVWCRGSMLPRAGVPVSVSAQYFGRAVAKQVFAKRCAEQLPAWTTCQLHDPLPSPYGARP